MGWEHNGKRLAKARPLWEKEKDGRRGVGGSHCRGEGGWAHKRGSTKPRKEN